MRAALLNVGIFQLGWLACMLGAAHGLPWTGTTLAALGVAWHLATAAPPWRELLLVLLVAVAGGLWDSALVSAGLVSYASGTVVPDMAPHWIPALWALFATTLNRSLRWLHGRLLLAALLGAMGGPLAYHAGAALGAATLTDPPRTLALLAAGWALLLPLGLALAARLDAAPAVRETRRV